MRTLFILVFCLLAESALAADQLYTLEVRDANMGDFATYEIRNEETGEKSVLTKRNRTDSWIQVSGKEFKVLRQFAFRGKLEASVYVLQEDGFGTRTPKSLLFKNKTSFLHLKTRGSSSREFILEGVLQGSEVRITFEKFPGTSRRFDDAKYNAYGDKSFLRSYVSGTEWSYRVKIWGNKTDDIEILSEQKASVLGIMLLHLENPTSR